MTNQEQYDKICEDSETLKALEESWTGRKSSATLSLLH